jgi:hypothetical protein
MNFLGLAILGKYPDMYPWILIVSGYSSNSQGYKYPDTPDTQVSVGITDRDPEFKMVL